MDDKQCERPTPELSNLKWNGKPPPKNPGEDEIQLIQPEAAEGNESK